MCTVCQKKFENSHKEKHQKQSYTNIILVSNLYTNEQSDKNILQTNNIASKILLFDILGAPETEISYIAIIRFLTSHFSSLMFKKMWSNYLWNTIEIPWNFYICLVIITLLLYHTLLCINKDFFHTDFSFIYDFSEISLSIIYAWHNADKHSS